MFNPRRLPAVASLLFLIGSLSFPALVQAQAQHLQLEVLHSFGVYDDVEARTNLAGARPRESLVVGPDDKFYGTTSDGGAGGAGVIFSLTPDGQFAPLHDLFKDTDGERPTGPLVAGDGGNFFGTTLSGGPEGGGTLFKISPGGEFSLLKAFGYCGDSGLPGIFPAVAPQGLARHGSGNFYGTTFHDGLHCMGSVFLATPAGQVTTIYSFTPPECGTPTSCTNLDGALPETPLILGTDGNFYGTTYIGGTGGSGTIFKITPLGIFTTLHSFDAAVAGENGGTSINADGFNPGSALTEGVDGNFYGTTSRGGANGLGTIFRITSQGQYTVLHTFSHYGAQPLAGLLRANDGNFYGVGEHHFRITPAGEFTVLVVPDADEFGPLVSRGTLIQTADGAFHGTSFAGGAAGTGTVYSLTLTDSFTSAPTLSLEADDTTAMVGQAIWLGWVATDATWCKSSGGSASDDWPGYTTPTQMSKSVTEDTPGTYTYSLACEGPGGTVTDSVEVQVRPASAPVVSLDASASEALAGTPFVLTWSTEDATSCLGSGGAPDDGWSGSSRAVSSSATITTNTPGTYTYSLSCDGPGGSATDGVQVRVTSAAAGSESGGGSGGGGFDWLMLAVLSAAGFRRRADSHAPFGRRPAPSTPPMV